MKNLEKPNKNNQVTDFSGSRRLAVAPMLDWTDRHYRMMARLISRHVWLYTEMIHAGAVVYGDPDRFLDYNEGENPLALQLGGSEPALLAAAAKRAAAYRYDEINLNCGCPSPRVQRGAFGACLMQDAPLVADCLNAMQDAVPDIPVTIKHRIGIDRQTEYAPLADFVGTLSDKTACGVFIVHARNAWLDGLSPKENRDIPPLRYDYVHRLKREFPQLEIIINGGIDHNDAVAEQLAAVDGVMVGRACYHNPMIMHEWDRHFYGSDEAAPDLDSIVHGLYDYACRQLAAGRGTTLRHMVRHYLGLTHGLNGARQWRRMLSDAALLSSNNPQLILDAWQAVQRSD